MDTSKWEAAGIDVRPTLTVVIESADGDHGGIDFQIPTDTDRKQIKSIIAEALTKAGFEVNTIFN